MKRLCDSTGFSMLEVMAAIALFAIVSAGVAKTTLSTIQANTTSKELTTASALVQDKIEEFRALDPTTNPASLTAGEHNDPNNPLSPLGDRGASFQRSWTVQLNTPAQRISQVVVRVTWNGPVSRTVTGITYVCQTKTCS